MCKHHKEVLKQQGGGSKNLKPVEDKTLLNMTAFPFLYCLNCTVFPWTGTKLWFSPFIFHSSEFYAFCFVYLLRNWCPHTVTKTVTCQVQNGTVLQRVYQTCRWPQGCSGGRWEETGLLPIVLQSWGLKKLQWRSHYRFWGYVHLLNLISEFSARKLLFIKTKVPIMPFNSTSLDSI